MSKKLVILGYLTMLSNRLTGWKTVSVTFPGFGQFNYIDMNDENIQKKLINSFTSMLRHQRNLTPSELYYEVGPKYESEGLIRNQLVVSTASVKKASIDMLNRLDMAKIKFIIDMAGNVEVRIVVDRKPDDNA